MVMNHKKVFSQDEVEQILFDKSISDERDGEYRVGIKTNSNRDIHAELTIYKVENSKYKSVFSCNAVIGKNGPGKQCEGDLKTPLGTWTVGEAYGIAKNPGSLLQYTQIIDDMYWCAMSTNDKKYNSLIYRSDVPDADYSQDEHLIDYPIEYKYFIDIGYNKDRIPYVGSAIFLHCWKSSETPTGGCIAVSKESMIKILKTITPGTIITIY